jgi:hypothetical protein
VEIQFVDLDARYVRDVVDGRHTDDLVSLPWISGSTMTGPVRVAQDFGASVADLLRGASVLRQQVHQPGMVSTSVAQHELNLVTAELGTPEPIERLISLVDLWSSIAAEQLHDVGVLVEGARSVFGIFPNIRSVIEHGAWITYLLDNQVGPDERARRAALAELQSQQKLVAAAAHMTDKDNLGYKALRANLDCLREAIAAQFPGFDASTGTIDGERVAAPTAVVKFFGGRFGDSRQWFGMYEYLCGTANHPSKNAFEFFEVQPDGKTELTLTVEFMNKLARAGLSPYLNALQCMRGYFDWASEPIAEYQRRVVAVLGPDPA